MGLFCLSDVAEVLYKTTEFWYAEDEHTIIGMTKPSISNGQFDDLIISDKDKKEKK